MHNYAFTRLGYCSLRVTRQGETNNTLVTHLLHRAVCHYSKVDPALHRHRTVDRNTVVVRCRALRAVASLLMLLSQGRLHCLNNITRSVGSRLICPMSSAAPAATTTATGGALATAVRRCQPQDIDLHSCTLQACWRLKRTVTMALSSRQKTCPLMQPNSSIP